MTSAGTQNALIRRLGIYEKLSDHECALIGDVARARVRRVRARQDIHREGDKPEFVTLVLSGWAYRYKTLENGRRQIVAFLLPGDLCDLDIYLLDEMDHSVGSLTPVMISELHRAAVEDLRGQSERIARALRWDMLIANAIQREWTVNLGQRTAIERIGHLLCELFLRLRAIGMVDGATCTLPLTQTELADTTGLSTVHVNRTLQELRASKLIAWAGNRLTIPDLNDLMAASLFNPNYLHLNQDRS